MQITAYMLSCGERALVRRDTVERLARTDWLEPPRVVLDAAASGRPQERQSRNARSLLERAIADGPDFLLFLEDDLEFNAYLGSNLAVWAPLAGTPSGGHFFASLYNPGVRELRREPSQAFFVADANSVYGSQAFVLSLATARHIAGHWEDVIGMQDIKMSRLAGAAGPIYYHAPSLVQHVPVPSVWGGGYHSAGDFEREWKSAAAAADSAARSCGPLDRDAILRQMRGIDGWLDDQEAHLLMTTVAEALDRTAPQLDSALIEIGSFHDSGPLLAPAVVNPVGRDEPGHRPVEFLRQLMLHPGVKLQIERLQFAHEILLQVKHFLCGHAVAGDLEGKIVGMIELARHGIAQALKLD